MFDGLYAGSSALTQDFALVLQRMQVGLGSTDWSQTSALRC